ncbi:unnamed protein product [Lactuca saligna]|uniref:CCAAT-binding factor domain-containing protein n=1 Tax=Lactuca saligna TaxID=75948 RepID=A0AA35ZXJ2_LACSI|nr:unnamed protein product [Lactuca saligna]
MRCLSSLPGYVQRPNSVPNYNDEITFQSYLAAAFAKKLSKLALTVPPSGGLVIIALIHNLLRRHPSINCLVHQEDDGETETVKSGIDHFNNEETDLLKTNAMKSVTSKSQLEQQKRDEVFLKDGIPTLFAG